MTGSGAPEVQKTANRLMRSPVCQDVVTLCEQLRTVEGSTSSDETLMALIASSERRILTTLAHIPAQTFVEATQKLTVVTRRAEASSGYLSGAELLLLKSALRDMTAMGI